MMSHIKTVNFWKKSVEYELEIDTEDPDNYVIETVTVVDGSKPEEDIDPEIFQENLDQDDWVAIHELLENAK